MAGRENFEVDDEIVSIARKRFGFKELRPGQAEAIRQVVRGKDTLAIFPTGAGKSAIYQIAGLALEGATVVVSPLIALQRDQVESINESGAADAEQINSGRTGRERADAFARLDDGDLEYIFLAPEQLANPATMERLVAARPSLFVVDEAHCISEWGHDFRPDYARLGDVIDELGHPITLALTATASPPVREEIVERLHMREPALLVQGFDRPNITLDVLRFRNRDEKREVFFDAIQERAKPGIVYTATRNDAEELAGALQSRGFRAAAYHAGMRNGSRDDVQSRFMDDDLDVIVATIAFGMGIDKSNVRFVIHYSISESVDSYYQEFGRAGRDGVPARATILYVPDDLNLRRFQSASGRLGEDDALKVLREVKRVGAPVDAGALSESLNISEMLAERALARLADVGAVEFGPDGAAMVPGVRVSKQIAIDAAELQERHRRVARTRLDMMRQYADTSDCRRGFMLNYFGEPFDPPCGNCDNCLSGRAAESLPDSAPFPVSSRVMHETWGEGEVVRYERDMMTVLFADAGYRTLDTDLVVQEGILRSAEC